MLYNSFCLFYLKNSIILTHNIFFIFHSSACFCFRPSLLCALAYAPSAFDNYDTN
ncbi:hypothetical protein Hanom_Chr16g01501771 [Helianthus anomalus]